jgi:hypothetical protein
MNQQGSLTYVHPGNRKVRLALFWVSNYFGNNYVDLLRQTETMLNAHGLALDCWPGKVKVDTTKIDFDDTRPNHSLVQKADYDSLYDAAFNLLSTNGKTKSLPILFVNFQSPDNGLTVTDTATKCLAHPMCLISPSAGGDNVTLLHEIGHAGGLDHDQTSTGATDRNFMNMAQSRSTMMQWQIVKLAQAYFVQP